MIINWSDKISNVLCNSNEEEILNIENELNELLDALKNREEVIIKLKDGIRMEITPYYSEESFNIRDITRDFNEIYKHNELKQELLNAEKTFIEKAKDQPEIIKQFSELLELRKKLSYYKFYIKLVETKNGKSKVTNEYSNLSIEMTKAYLIGIMNSIGIYFKSDEFIFKNK